MKNHLLAVLVLLATGLFAADDPETWMIRHLSRKMSATPQSGKSQ